MENATVLIDRLGRFPHIQKKLNLYWGCKECRDFLGSLTMSDRPNRQGFPFDAVLAIDALIDLHDTEYLIFKPLLDPAWNDVQSRSI
jgi:hypothetical protein